MSSAPSPFINAEDPPSQQAPTFASSTQADSLLTNTDMSHAERRITRTHALATRGAVLPLLGVLFVLGGLTTIWALRLGTNVAIYVSGFGASGRSTALAFNSGLGLIGLGGVCIAFALLQAPSPRSRSISRALFFCLFLASLCFIAASRITCSPGCPLPFTAQAVWQDAVHVILACLGFGLALVTILLSATMGRGVRRLVIPTVCGVALPAGAGGILALFGISPLLGGWLELVATTVALSWLVVFGILVALRAPTLTQTSNSSRSPA